MYKLKLAIRYILKRPISWLAIGAVALCVFMVVVVMTVLAGLVTQFKAKNHDFVGDCIVHTSSLVGFPYYEDFIAELEKSGIGAAASPVVRTWALLAATGSERNIAVELMGIDPDRHCKVTNWGRSLFYNRGDCTGAFIPYSDPNRPGIVIGIELIGPRDVFGNYRHDSTPPNYELAVSCFPLTAKGTLAKLGTDLINTKIFYYSDDSHTGLAQADTGYIYVPLEDAQMLSGMAGAQNRATAVFIKFDSDDEARQTAQVRELWKKFAAEKSSQPYADLLNNVRVESWREYAREAIAPLEKEQAMMTVLFCLVGLITVFIIFVIFSMLVGSKTKDIGILKSFGAADQAVAELFLLVSGAIGLFGSAIGASAALAFIANINKIEDYFLNRFGLALWDRTMYAIDAIPSSIDLILLVVIIAAAILACLGGALIPALAAARKKPVEILQVNQI